MKRSTALFLFILVIWWQHRPSSAQTPVYELDHLIFFVQDSTCQVHLDSLLTRAEQLETVHSGQGTRGVYYLLLNGFLELLYLQNPGEARQNEERFGSRYTVRWSDPSALPIGFGLKMTPFDTAQTDFEYTIYESEFAPRGEYYMMAKGNQDPAQPMVFITLPHRAQKVFESLEEARTKIRPEIREEVMRYLTHPSGSQKITAVEIAVPSALLNAPNIQLLSKVKGVRIKEASAFSIGIFLDEGQRQRIPFIAPYLPVSISY